jgi:hypothetical protein
MNFCLSSSARSGGIENTESLGTRMILYLLDPELNLCTEAQILRRSEREDMSPLVSDLASLLYFETENTDVSRRLGMMLLWNASKALSKSCRLGISTGSISYSSLQAKLGMVTKAEWDQGSMCALLIWILDFGFNGWETYSTSDPGGVL